MACRVLCLDVSTASVASTLSVEAGAIVALELEAGAWQRFAALYAAYMRLHKLLEDRMCIRCAARLDAVNRGLHLSSVDVARVASRARLPKLPGSHAILFVESTFEDAVEELRRWLGGGSAICVTDPPKTREYALAERLRGILAEGGVRVALVATPCVIQTLCDVAASYAAYSKLVAVARRLGVGAERAERRWRGLKVLVRRLFERLTSYV